MADAQRIVPVILSGGSGTRLWPMSRPERPKQLLPLTAEQTMLQLTARRTADPAHFEPPIVVANAAHADAIEDQLAENGTPAGALILKALSGVQVNTAFNSATTTVLDIGSAADGDLYATDLDVKSAAAFVPLDEAVSMVVATDTELTCQLSETGATASAGSAVVVIAFLPNN